MCIGDIELNSREIYVTRVQISVNITQVIKPIRYILLHISHYSR